MLASKFGRIVWDDFADYIVAAKDPYDYRPWSDILVSIARLVQIKKLVVGCPSSISCGGSDQNQRSVGATYQAVFAAIRRIFTVTCLNARVLALTKDICGVEWLRRQALGDHRRLEALG